MKTKVDLDIRYFRRYPKEAHCILNFQTGVCRARLVDYSLIGLGIIVDDLQLPINSGDVVSVAVDEPDLYGMGEVAWTARTTAGLRLGVRRTEALKGRFTLYPLSDVLVSLQRTRKTGVLEVSRGSLCKRVFIRNGEIICATSNAGKDRLGDVLLRKRRLSRKQYDKAAEMEGKTGSSCSSILLHMGYLNSEDLIRARQLQIRRILASLFLMKDAEFEFIEDLIPPEDEVLTNVAITDVVYREMKKIADIGLLESYLLDGVVTFSANPLNLFQNLQISAVDKAVLIHVDGKRSLGEILKLSESSRRVNSLKVIFALLEARVLRITGTAEVTPATDSRPALDKKKSDPVIDEIEQLYSEHRDLDHYRILGIKRDDSAEEITKAYFRAERKYHPDMYQLMGDDFDNRLSAIFTHMRDAYLTLIDAERRRLYDAELEKSKVQEVIIPEIPAEGTIVQEDYQTNEIDPARIQRTAYEDKSEISKVREEIVIEIEPGPGIVHEDHQKNEMEAGRIQRTAYEDYSGKAKLRFRNGKVAFWDNDFPKAARFFAAAIESDGSVPEFYYMYGRTLMELGKFKDAAQALSRANDLKPSDPDTLAELGHLYLKLGFPLRATGYFKQAIKLDPSNRRALEGMKVKGKKPR